MNQMSFVGEAIRCKCDCHKGLYKMHVCLVMPEGNRRPLATKYVAAEPTQQEMNELAESVGREFLRHMGIDAIRKVILSEGVDALKAEQAFVRENNPNLN